MNQTALECFGKGARTAPKRIRFIGEDQRFPLFPTQQHSNNNSSFSQQAVVLQLVSSSVVEAAKELVSKDQAKYDGAWFNSLNNHVFTPYKIQPDENESGGSVQTQLIIDDDWWRAQAEELRLKVQAFCNQHQTELKLCGDTSQFYPHDDAESPLLNLIYKAYHDQFVYRNFLPCISCKDDLTVVPLSSWDARWFVEVGRKRCLTGNALRDNDVEDVSVKTTRAIQVYLERHCDTGIFVKTQDKSAKNDITMKPLFTLHQVLSQLTFSRDVLGTLERMLSSSAKEDECYLILMPWQEQISMTNEFRVFCQNHKVRAVAQQRWYSNLTLPTHDAPLTPAKAVAAARAAVHEYENNWKSLLPSHWGEVVLDIWVEYGHQSSNANVDCQEDEQATAHLIEVNPGGRWSSSGSSLFEWRADVDILHRCDSDEDEDVYVRIAVADDYTSTA